MDSISSSNNGSNKSTVSIFLYVLLGIVGFIVIVTLYNSYMNHPKSEKFDNSNIVIYNFNTTWCGWSKRFQPVWDKFSETAKKELPNVKVVDVKCDDKQNDDLCKQFKVPGYPSVVAVVNGESKVYGGSRTEEDLLTFAKSLA